LVNLFTMSKTTIFHQSQKFNTYTRMKWTAFQIWWKQYGGKLALAFVIIYLLQQKDLSLQFNLQSIQTGIENIAASTPENTATTTEQPNTFSLTSLGSSLIGALKPTTETTVSIQNTSESNNQTTSHDNKDNLSNTYSNMTYSGPSKSSSTNKKQKQAAYIQRFASVAQSEMKKYGVPASIKLAQGLIESNAGESRLSQRNNNHFGMKCFSKNCKKGHCSNFTDDSHKDFFRTYKTAWESYRSHSLMLKESSRYRSLFKLRSNDYKGWAYGLKRAGYATDKRYAEKLIHIIQEMRLYEYDK